ncbi:MAG: hypothetical protein IK037_00630, partial [Clostridia bacterium]|nr:hypothetical protein [Clostridia bacterium]
MLKSMLKNLNAHVTIDRAVDNDVVRIIEAYFYNNCLYLDLSSLGLPKAALPMNLADLIPEEKTSAAEEEFVCGCDNPDCLDEARRATYFDPTHPCRINAAGEVDDDCNCR